ncbi:MAG TPA: hypothetical protein VHV55_09620 [Pirellulales bacterium]|jgi:hypothetical protein|nr:hypothetical protein [Pirellulales bacterium]
MIPLRPLLADLALLKAIMFVVVIAIYAINHLLSGLKKPLAGPPPRVPPPGTPPARRPPVEAEAPAANPDLNAELSDFLRRAAAKRQQAGGQPSQSAPTNVERPATRPPRKRKKSEPPARPPEERLSQRRALPTLDTRAMDERSLATRPAEQLGDHVRESFDRQLGLLAADSEKAPGAEPPPTAELQSSVAVEMSALLCNPQSLRGAIILNEILTRPEHRW